ncbi:hypothetical protein E2562_010615 [Oryza meyeriana var. granulata]|uniref:Uncharacterized protein n=1 Tax=Oryza meyeriana var. granulata TaxID=110450 RepID=A0A6G1BV44_9ORYZ|nr:hypothetical protein E2562_010615 [Oryza meyeriana var. granulata]
MAEKAGKAAAPETAATASEEDKAGPPGRGFGVKTRRRCRHCRCMFSSKQSVRQITELVS